MIKFDENCIGIPIPLYEEIIIYITDLKYGKHKNIFVEAAYENILFEFSVFSSNRYSSADINFAVNILNEDRQLETPDFHLIAKFDLTKSGYLKCLSARILDE